MGKGVAVLVVVGIAGIVVAIMVYNSIKSEKEGPPITSQYTSLKYVCHATQLKAEGTFGWQTWNWWGVVNSTVRPQGYYEGSFTAGNPTDVTVKGVYLDRCLGPFSNSSEACPAVKKANILNVLNEDALRDVGCLK